MTLLPVGAMPLAAMLVPVTAAAPKDAVIPGAVILIYHRFGESRYPSTNIRLEQFEAHIEMLQKGGFSVLPLADIADALEGGGTLPDRAVAITIDDAFRSVRRLAAPTATARQTR